jgi:aminopeptidase N
MNRFLFSFLLLFSFAVLRSQSIGDSLHVVHYIIEIDNINTSDKSISGNSRAMLTPVSGSVSGIALQLIQLTVDSVFIDGSNTNFTHNDGVIQIPLSQNINVGDTLEARVYYHGQPFHEGWGGFHFAGEYAFNLGVGFQSIPHNLGKSWFACIDDFTDRATYDLYATVENSKKAIGGGMLIGSLDNGDGTTTWHWYLAQDIPTYLESLTIGDYILNPDEYFGIQDTIPIDIYSRPQDTANVNSSFLNLKQILRIFEDHFGAYPFDRIGYSATSLGAMEHATNISYPYSGFNGSTSSEWWYTHELSHMWFGDMLTCSTAEDMWLNEGWATFCQIFYTEILYSEEDYKLGMRDKLKDVLMKTHIIDNGYYALNDIPQQYTYGSTAYDKGCVVAGALRTYLGDSIFFDGISAYLQNFAYQSVSSYQMRDFLSQHTGIDMTGFFDNWVFTPGTPHYSIDSTSLSANGKNYQLDIWLKQKHKGYDFIGNDNIVQLGYLKNDFTFEFDTMMFSGLNGHSVKTLDFQPIAVLLDPEEKMMDATVDNYMKFTEPVDYVFPDTYFKILIGQLEEPAFIQATNDWVAPDSLKTEVPGLRISPNRHWTIGGYFPEGMQAQGRFYYDNGVYLDAPLIQSQSDSVVVLYRENPSQDWQNIPQNRMGIWSVGYIFIDDLQTGEYTLAVYDLSVGNKEQKKPSVYKIFPNPARSELNFDFPQEGNYLLELNNANGSIIDSISFKGKKEKWQISPGNLKPGPYVLFIYESGKLITVERVVFVK